MVTFKIGDRVIHKNWGKGIITANYGGTSQWLVKFDKPTPYGIEAEVSTGMLKLIKRVP